MLCLKKFSAKISMSQKIHYKKIHHPGNQGEAIINQVTLHWSCDNETGMRWSSGELWSEHGSEQKWWCFGECIYSLFTICVCKIQ